MIRCPADCAHLTSAREHPAAATRKAQERDVAAIVPAMRDLNERQRQLFFLFNSVVLRHRPAGPAALTDADVADAAGSAAATIETAGRGVIFEHRPQSLVAQPLAAEFQALPEDLRRQGAQVFDREIALALRAVERGAREVGHGRDGDRSRAYLDLIARLIPSEGTADAPGAGAGSPDQPRSAIVLP